MTYQLTAIFILAAFYGIYLAKLVIQKRRSIRTNQVGIGNKPRRVRIIEQVMSVATVLACFAAVCSIFCVKGYPAQGMRAAGAVSGIAAVFVFAMATGAMKDSWRVGIPEEKTELITNGIYKYSRNPAFVGFDLLYLSMNLMFFNIPLALISVWAAVMLHLQILQEEVHMQKMFGEDYDEYRRHTMRYFGKRK